MVKLTLSPFAHKNSEVEYVWMFHRACVEGRTVMCWFREDIGCVDSYAAETTQDCDIRGATADSSEAKGLVLQSAKYRHLFHNRGFGTEFLK